MTFIAFKIIGLDFINKLQKIVGNIRCFLFKKSLLRIVPLRGFGGYSRVISNSLLRIAPSFRKVRESGGASRTGGYGSRGNQLC